MVVSMVIIMMSVGGCIVIIIIAREHLRLHCEQRSAGRCALTLALNYMYACNACVCICGIKMREERESCPAALLGSSAASLACGAGCGTRGSGRESVSRKQETLSLQKQHLTQSAL